MADEGDKPGNDVTWLSAAAGELQAIRVHSQSTGGTYAVIESVVGPNASAPTHLHRNEEEHLLVLAGHYRIAVGDNIIDAPAGCHVTIPRNVPHSWRNIADGESRLIATIVPGGFEQLARRVQTAAPKEILALAAQYGCDILGPPGV
jgi:mannose-6-phosphate isomerase-like protein (cupin superfamily)